MMTTQPGSGQSHRVAGVMTWVLGAISVLLTSFLGYLALVIIGEWSGYVGAESQVALVILGVIGLLTVLSWLLTLVALAKQRSRKVPALVFALTTVALLAFLAAVMVI
jgi:hypothetical protein